MTNSIIWKIEDYDLIINHPNKLYWIKQQYTKLDLLKYYKNIAPTILPYLKNRPVTIHYFPNGIEKFSFYKRNFKNNKNVQNLFHTIAYNEVSQDKTIHVPIIDNTAGLLHFVSKGAIEFHLWSSTMPNFKNPDIAIFDLDVSQKVDFTKVLKIATYLNELLTSMNIKSFPKTTGGSGIHVFVPILPIYSFKQVREWVKSIGDILTESHPDLITTQRKSRKTHINNKITLDYLQNVMSRNTIAPYSVRAYNYATVSTPVSWKEVNQGKFLPKDFTIKNVSDRLKKIGDLFLEVLTSKQELPI